MKLLTSVSVKFPDSKKNKKTKKHAVVLSPITIVTEYQIKYYLS